MQGGKRPEENILPEVEERHEEKAGSPGKRARQAQLVRCQAITCTQTEKAAAYLDEGHQVMMIRVYAS